MTVGAAFPLANSLELNFPRSLLTVLLNINATPLVTEGCIRPEDLNIRNLHII
jgi:hypothetical protein